MKAMHPALEFLYRLKSLEDLALLKTESFLEACAVSDISLHLKSFAKGEDFDPPVLSPELGDSRNSGNLSIDSDPPVLSCELGKSQEPTQNQAFFEFRQNLYSENQSYGTVVFYSTKKFSSSKKSFLEKLSHALSVSLFLIHKNKELGRVGSQWADTFNSFPQSFCITNFKFQILCCNQAFRKLFPTSKKDLLFENLFKLFPESVKIPKFFRKRPSSFIAIGEEGKLYWRVFCQKLNLKEESQQSFLFLIKDISTEMGWEAKISAQSKNQEIGLMKGSLAHELNNPITGIQLIINIIEKEIPDSEKEIRENLKEMQKSISTCQNVIQSLLSASKTPISS